MNVTIDNPELVQFIDSEVRSGRFASAEQVVAAALSDRMSRAGEDVDVDDATAERLNRAYERAVRGEGGHTIEEARERLLGRRADL